MGLYFVVDVVGVELLGHCDLHSADGLSQLLGEIRNRLAGACRVVRVVCADGVEHNCAVPGVGADGTYLVEGACECDKTIAGNSAVGGLDSGHAAEGRGLSDGAAGVASERSGSEGSRHSRSASAGGTAGNSLKVVGVLGLGERGGLCGAAHREFVHAGLAEEHVALCVELLDNGRIVRRYEILKHLTCTGGLDTVGADVVLDGERDTGQRAHIAGINALLCVFSHLERLFLGNGDEGLYLAVAGFYISEIFSAELCGADLL